MSLPQVVRTVAEHDELLFRPTPLAQAACQRLDGDLLVLGAGGKMGPSLAVMAQRAIDAAGRTGRVVAVSRFNDPKARQTLETEGVTTLAGDLLDDAFVASLPHAANVVYMAGMKFGASGNPSRTWAMNVLMPGMVARRFRDSRVVAFSTGNVYGMVPTSSAGSQEGDEPRPCGEYAQSCLGRERMFEHVSDAYGTRVGLLRLNYAHTLQYGVLVDLATRVAAGEPIDLAMGYFNAIWQGDANAVALAMLADTACPPDVVNVTGREKLRVRDVCQALGEAMGNQAKLVGTEADDAFLSDAARMHGRYGPPTVGVEQLIAWTADWVRRGMPLMGKPTKFNVRDGAF
ncbi:MAG: NAD(P)-dependent oxidoreductase [Pirellulales bacterium]